MKKTIIMLTILLTTLLRAQTSFTVGTNTVPSGVHAATLKRDHLNPSGFYKVSFLYHELCQELCRLCQQPAALHLIYGEAPHRNHRSGVQAARSLLAVVRQQRAFITAGAIFGIPKEVKK